MSLVTLLPLAAAGAIAAGCAALHARRLDAERVGFPLVSMAAILALMQRVRPCPVDPGPDPVPEDPSAEGPAPGAAITVLRRRAPGSRGAAQPAAGTRGRGTALVSGAAHRP